MVQAPDNSTGIKPAHAAACDLPLSAEVPHEQRTPAPVQKDIHKTLGGKLTHFGIYGVLGFAGNSGLSIGITYLLNPREWVKNLKEPVAKGIEKMLSGLSKDPLRMSHRMVEIGFMTIAGTILTSAMVPLIKRRDKIAYWVNQKLGVDKDVLPDHLKAVPEPHTLEEKISQEVDKRVERHHTSADVWKARWTALAVPLAGEMLLSNWNSKREKAGQSSVDTKILEGGTHFYDNVLAKRPWVDKVSNFFEKHGASMEEMQKHAPENFNVLKSIEEKLHPGEMNKSRMMVADQGRMLAKEIGWTVILAVIMERLVPVFHNRRVKKEEQKALAEVTQDGFVPKGYKAVLKEGVTLEPLQGTSTHTAAWSGKKAPSRLRPEKSESYVAGVEGSRAITEQPAIG